jgi:hypothetical protein
MTSGMGTRYLSVLLPTFHWEGNGFGLWGCERALVIGAEGDRSLISAFYRMQTRLCLSRACGLMGRVADMQAQAGMSLIWGRGRDGRGEAGGDG